VQNKNELGNLKEHLDNIEKGLQVQSQRRARKEQTELKAGEVNERAKIHESDNFR
jgi:hypothetical protein